MDDPRAVTKFPDSNVGMFKEEDRLLVREFFLTVQGEMPFTGKPAVFLRLGGCNRGSKQDICSACDTSFEVSKSRWYDVNTLAEIIYAMLNPMSAHPVPLLVITGGEPVLQKKALCSFINKLAILLWENDSFLKYASLFTVQLETNGDFDATSLLALNSNEHNVNVVAVVSPKEPHKNKPWFVIPRESFGGEAVTKFILLDKVYIRRVVCNNENSRYFNIPEYMLNLNTFDRTHCYLSGTTVYGSDGEIDFAASAENTVYAVQLAIKHGFNVSFQSHAYVGVR